MSAKGNPRQKMINLMYIVLIAMLALNVSSEVLEGFTVVQESLERSTKNTAEQNQTLFSNLAYFYDKNPEKTKQWYDKGMQVKESSDSLYTYIEKLKMKIAQAADGPDANPSKIKKGDDLEAASSVLLGLSGKGQLLKEGIIQYRDQMLAHITDSLQRINIEANFNMNDRVKGGISQSWENALCENMPVTAVITILTKLQNDIRYTEAEALHFLLKNIDLGDFRVNSIKAYVLPQSKNIMRGGRYSANIVLSAEDSTKRNRIFINNKELNPGFKGLFEVPCNTLGDFQFSGYIEMERGDGTTIQHPFADKYTVIEPMATVSASMMNVFYAGIDNPVSISVPGVPHQSVSASITNGTLVKSGNGWIARPQKIGTEAVVSVTAEIDGKRQNIASVSFKVRPLPPPLPYIRYTDEKGNASKYKGSAPFSKASLLASQGVGAAIDDDLLNVTFRVLSFETNFFDSMGNASIDKSDGANFSTKQVAKFKRAPKGAKFFISAVIAVGPDGVERKLPPIEVIVN